jgi:hypothetical protein
MFILRKECAREHVCRHTAYESPERHKRYNMHGLKQQNAFGWTDITCTCLIYLFLFLFECVKMFFENRFRSGHVDILGFRKRLVGLWCLMPLWTIFQLIYFDVVSLKDFFKWTIMDFVFIVQKKRKQLFLSCLKSNIHFTID